MTKPIWDIGHWDFIGHWGLVILRPLVIRLLSIRPRRQERELALFLFALDDDGRLDQDEQDLIVLGHAAVGEEALEEGDLAEYGYAGFAFDFAGDALPAEQQGAAVGDRDRGSYFGDLHFGLLNDAGVAERLRRGIITAGDDGVAADGERHERQQV